MAEPEIMPESGEVTESKLWIGDKKVKSYKRTEKTTPGGTNILDIVTEDGDVKLTEAKFDAIKGYKKSDMTEARNKLVRVAGQKMYALLMEYGPGLPEVDHILNEAVRLANDATEQANNALWGVEHSHERTLLDVNNILAKKYEASTIPPDAEAAPQGDGADSADTKEG